MTVVKAAELVTGVAGVSYVAAESIIPEASWLDKLGVMSIVVVVCGLIVNWMMKQLEKKDQTLQAVQQQFTEALKAANDAAAKSHTESTALIVAELRQSHEVKRQVAESLSALTSAIRSQR